MQFVHLTDDAQYDWETVTSIVQEH